MKKLALLLAIYLLPNYSLYSQCNYSILELIDIVKMNDAQVKAFIYYFELTHNETDDIYYCDDESGTIMIRSEMELFKFTTITTKKDLYTSWQNEVFENENFRYIGEFYENGNKVNVYEYVVNDDFPVGVTFMSGSFDEISWFGAVRFECYYD